MFQVIFKVRSTIFELNHQTVIWLFSLMSFWNFWVFKHRCQELSLYTVWCQSWTLKLTLNCSAQVWWFLIAVVFICTRRPPTLWFAHFSITISVIPLGNYTAPLWLGMRKWLQIVTYITLLSSIKTRRCCFWWETFWLQKNSLQLLWHQPQWSVVCTAGESMCFLALIRDSASYRWNQGSEMWWGDCWSSNISAIGYLKGNSESEIVQQNSVLNDNNIQLYNNIQRYECNTNSFSHNFVCYSCTLSKIQ